MNMPGSFSRANNAQQTFRDRFMHNIIEPGTQFVLQPAVERIRISPERHIVHHWPVICCSPPA
ncbi:hypothetical protein SXCC_00659 [Gluconacetobacter sp. SXCC-1]|nr:hypothetical protein SXCC_00659 [Gluconacetobacter sp. SXCC-1]